MLPWVMFSDVSTSSSDRPNRTPSSENVLGFVKEPRWEVKRITQVKLQRIDSRCCISEWNKQLKTSACLSIEREASLLSNLTHPHEEADFPPVLRPLGFGAPLQNLEQNLLIKNETQGKGHEGKAFFKGKEKHWKAENIAGATEQCESLD